MSSESVITSDTFILELFSDWTGKFFYGPDFMQRTHCFSMTPDIHIVASNPHHDMGNKIKRKTLFDNEKDNHKILELNFEHPRNAMGYVYANDKLFLQDIVDDSNLHDKQIREKQEMIMKMSLSDFTKEKGK